MLLQGCSKWPIKINTRLLLPNNAIKKAESTKPVDPLAKFDKAKSAQLTDTAKLLAGMEVDSQSSLAKVQQNRGWNSHQNYYKNAWSKLENRQLAKVRNWRKKELQAINAKSPSVFYPFSGPDFLYAFSLFPKAKEMVFSRFRTCRKRPRFCQTFCK